MKIPTPTVRPYGFIASNGDRELPQFYAVHPDFPAEYCDTETEAINTLQRMRDFAATPNTARTDDKVLSVKYPTV